MGMWSFYFLGKLYLYFRGYIRFNLILNFVFMLFVLLPVPKNLSLSWFLRTVKFLLSVVCAFLLLWYDSWLPSLGNVFHFLTAPAAPSGEYIVRFLIDSVNPRELGILCIIFAFCFAVRKRVTLAPVVIFLMGIILLAALRHRAEGKEDVEKYLDAFYQSESKRIIHFDKATPRGPDFDIVLLHICSLGWDDLRAVGLDSAPFFKQFNLLFTNFNSVTAYSNPSAIRLLRANCGQQKHGDLYHNTQQECYLMESLRAEGYTTFTALDHDGVYGNFLEQVRTFGKADPAIATNGFVIRQYDFDNSPIFDDLQVLEKWWDVRQKSESKRAALYFNAISLHSGSHRADVKNWWTIDRKTHYRGSVKELFTNFGKFFDTLASSGRNVLVVFIPEHGMALQGSSIQAPDLRDIPLPQITTVPVGIKMIGKGYPLFSTEQKIISSPSSYLALSYLLASFIQESPFGESTLISQKIMENIPETPFVSENEGIRVVKEGQDYFLYGKDKKWTKLSPSVVK